MTSAQRELVVSAGDYIAADGVTNDAPNLAAMFASLPAGARVLMPDKPVLLNGIVPLPKRVTVMGGDLRAMHSGPALWVRASGTVIDGTTIRGNGNTTYDGNVVGIRANGTADNPFTDIQILGVTVTGVQGSGIRLEYVRRSLVERTMVDGFVYMGIQLSSAEDVRIDGCRVANANHLTANSYGISVSDSLNTIEARSKHVTISRCTIEGVREWVGIETHGGYDIRVLDNTVLGCASGVAMVSGAAARICSAERVNVQGNYIDYSGASAQRGGLRLQGKPGALASGILRANTVVGYTSPTIFADYDADRSDVSANITA